MKVKESTCLRIKEARKNKKMTQKELADAIGVNYSIISKYEKGIVEPPNSRLKAIAKVLGVSIDYLNCYDGSTEMDFLNNSSNIYDYKNADFSIRNDSLLYQRLISYSKGICELCGNKAPFIDQNGNPYLELHQLKSLSDGGLPIPENTVALCPNCHSKIHIINDPEDLKILIKASRKHIET